MARGRWSETRGALPSRCLLASQEERLPSQAQGWARGFSRGSPHPAPSPGELGIGSYLSDEDSADFLVIPTEGGKELMVSCGEAALVAGAAAWVGRGGQSECSGSYTQCPLVYTLPRSHLLELPSVQPALPSPILKPRTPSPDLSPKLLLIFLVLSLENELSSPFPFPPPWLGTQLCYTNATLPSVSPTASLDTQLSVAKLRRDTRNPRTT